MKKDNTREKKKAISPKLDKGITGITVGGFKSIYNEQKIEIRPLTILAGANSSGKSSIMQPLLLLKQTLEESFDPGALLLTGPNVKFTSANQLFSRTSGNKNHSNIFKVGIEVDSRFNLIICFQKLNKRRGLTIQRMEWIDAKKNEAVNFQLGMKHEEMMRIIPKRVRDFYDSLKKGVKANVEWTVVRQRCFLSLNLIIKGKERESVLPISPSPGSDFEPHIRKVIHLPGWRGNPEREYPMTSFAPTFHGTFEKYVATVIMQWQERKDKKLNLLIRALRIMGLTWRIATKPISDTQVELHVGRLSHATKGRARDMVSIADVGFGVSQILPVLVALIEAKPGQMVYIEQPEIHLHPRARYQMAQILVEAASRGIKVIAETHCKVLLRGIQTQVANNPRLANLVKLHWFARRAEDGSTRIDSANLDREGAFGDWPEDFDEVELEVERQFLNSPKI